MGILGGKLDSRDFSKFPHQRKSIKTESDLPLDCAQLTNTSSIMFLILCSLTIKRRMKRLSKENEGNPKIQGSLEGQSYCTQDSGLRIRTSLSSCACTCPAHF